LTDKIMPPSNSTPSKSVARDRLGAELRSSAELIALQIPIDPNDDGVSLAFYKIMPELAQTFRLVRQGGLYGVLCHFVERAESLTPAQARMLWPHVITAAINAKKFKAGQAKDYCRRVFPTLWSLVENKPVPVPKPTTPEPLDQSIEARLARLEERQAQHEGYFAQIKEFLNRR
jgi:hypothetical protein